MNRKKEHQQMFVHVILQRLSTRPSKSLFWEEEKFNFDKKQTNCHSFQRYVFLKIKTMNAKINSRLEAKTKIFGQMNEASHTSPRDGKKNFFRTKKWKKKLFWEWTASKSSGEPFENANVKIQKILHHWWETFSRQKQKKTAKMCGQHEKQKKKAKSKCFGQKHECDWFLRKKSTLNTKFWIQNVNFSIMKRRGNTVLEAT